ncbi:MAG: Dabb family protein [Anaerolineaceae bacterium]|nr:Dabb family protein [Anaerolineaceae bacterium]
MHHHLVFFWLSDQLTDSERRCFEIELEALIKTPSVLTGYYGMPADTHRPVVDRSYSYGLTLNFSGIAEHDQYQIDPVHLAFVERNSNKWGKVLIYDIETSPKN